MINDRYPFGVLFSLFFFFWFAYAQMHNHNCVHTFLILELSVYRLNIVYYVQTIINDTSKTALNDINLNG